MSEMSNQISENNVNRAGPVGGRFFARQVFPGSTAVTRSSSTTVRAKWCKNVNKIFMECFFRSKPLDDDSKLIRGYRQRMMQE